MKKLSILLLSLMAVTMFTACNDSDEPTSKQTISATINNRAIDGDQVLFSQSTAKVELNYSDMLIKFTTDYKDVHGQSHSVTTPEMKMTAVSSSVYEFVASANQTGSTSLESFGGYIDMATGMMWFTINSGSNEVVCTTHLLYAYTNTSITNPENGNHGTHQQSAYLFALDTRGETCVMKISNFMANMNSAVDAYEIQFDNLTVTPNTNGYTITANEAKSNNGGFYTLTDVNITLNNQCRAISGSFKCNSLEYNLSGNLFSYNN